MAVLGLEAFHLESCADTHARVQKRPIPWIVFDDVGDPLQILPRSSNQRLGSYMLFFAILEVLDVFSNGVAVIL
jgi:hypothetical protein